MSYFEELITHNKLGISDLVEFEKVARKYTSLRMKDLNQESIQGNFDYQHLKDIHKYIFQDIFTWAGKDRFELK
ncbi:cell filamentation protein Fic, partial [Helicobacter monodelphidis]